MASTYRHGFGLITSSNFFVPQSNLPGSMAAFVTPAAVTAAMVPYTSAALTNNGGRSTRALLVRVPIRKRRRGLGQDDGIDLGTPPTIDVGSGGSVPSFISDVSAGPPGPASVSIPSVGMIDIGTAVPSTTQAGLVLANTPNITAAAQGTGPLAAQPTNWLSALFGTAFKMPATTATGTPIVNVIGGTGTAANPPATTSSLMPILLIGGLVLLVVVAAKKK